LELLVQIGPVLNRFGQSAKGKERETRKRHNRQKRFLPEPFGSNLLHDPILDIRGDHCKQHSYSHLKRLKRGLFRRISARNWETG